MFDCYEKSPNLDAHLFFCFFYFSLPLVSGVISLLFLGSWWISWYSPSHCTFHSLFFSPVRKFKFKSIYPLGRSIFLLFFSFTSGLSHSTKDIHTIILFFYVCSEPHRNGNSSREMFWFLVIGSRFRSLYRFHCVHYLDPGFRFQGPLLVPVPWSVPWCPRHARRAPGGRRGVKGRGHETLPEG